MARTNDYPKSIFCIESEWENTLKDPKTVEPMLRYFSDVMGPTWVKYIYRRCATLEGFEFYINKACQKKYEKYAIIYIAMHGEPGKLKIGTKHYSIEEIIGTIKKQLSNRIMHFGSCSTLDFDQDTFQNLIDHTNLAGISGYTKDVYFIESAAFELIYFEALQEKKELKAVDRYLQENYPALIDRLGFRMIHR